MSEKLSALIAKIKNKESLTEEECLDVLDKKEIQLLPLLNAAFSFRQDSWGKKVQIHILNNVQNGLCPEECHYCAQSKSSKAPIEKYKKKSESDILAEAKKAYESGAHRYCMVFSGRGPTYGRSKQIADLVQKIKKDYPLEVCVSAGLMDQKDTDLLKEAGLDRLNHNLNTSEGYYDKICTTHTFQDRLKTLSSAQRSGLEICSGVIIGMGESNQDIIQVAQNLKKLKVESIPVNFYMPIKGTVLQQQNIRSELSPEFCLRELCLFRFLNPTAEIRVAAGRELHLRALQPLALYPANSLFMEGYLNTKGTTVSETLQMIKDLDFEIESNHKLDDILKKESETKNDISENIILKGPEELMVQPTV